MINIKNILFIFNILAIILHYIGAILTFINISKEYDSSNFVIGIFILFSGLLLSYIQFKTDKIKDIINLNLDNKVYYLIFILQFINSLFMLTLNTIVIIFGSILLFISVFNLSYAFFIDENPKNIIETDEQQLDEDNID